MNPTTRPFFIPSALALALLASACGGGGGGSDSGTAGSPATTTLAPISQTNYPTVAATVAAPVGELVSVSSSAGTIVTGVEISQPSLTLANATLDIYKRFHAKGSTLVTGAVFTEACSGGGTVQIDETSASLTRITVGDRATITATNCKETGLPTMNGVMSLTITSVSGDPINSTNYSLGIATGFTNFSMTDGAERVSIQGDMAIAASQSGSASTNVSISGQSLAFTLSASGAADKSYRISAYTFTGTESGSTVTLSGRYTVSGSSTSLGGNYTYNVETVQPLVMSTSSDFPSSGAL
ncbi:MAG TPA: hypothetical protein VGE12_19070, partial [Noviherbaspirillum sp.]